MGQQKSSQIAKPPHKNRKLWLFLGAVFAIVAAIVFLRIANTTDFFNKAKSDANPMLSGIQKLGAQQICSGGDPGWGPDNLQPWYSADYVVPYSPMLSEQTKQIAASHGYPLRADVSQMNSLKTSNDPSNPYDSQTEYLIGQKTSDNSLNVTISPAPSFLKTPEATTDLEDCAQTFHSLMKQKDNQDQYVIGISLSLPDNKLP